jgi:hypothetical protein
MVPEYMDDGLAERQSGFDGHRIGVRDAANAVGAE